MVEGCRRRRRLQGIGRFQFSSWKHNDEIVKNMRIRGLSLSRQFQVDSDDVSLTVSAPFICVLRKFILMEQPKHTTNERKTTIKIAILLKRILILSYLVDAVGCFDTILTNSGIMSLNFNIIGFDFRSPRGMSMPNYLLRLQDCFGQVDKGANILEIYRNHCDTDHTCSHDAATCSFWSPCNKLEDRGGWDELAVMGGAERRRI
ncbi:hypothetical protein F2Q69_00047774 [Brassica cretica]|uniref:Uncharacterized protein n=1 Tax=Brassica cretica TaxID=69181 RepID=A0A8S9Q294_BRACR|nr:hypothetical protein F2Q69_00047774 [Brassica cretica]